MLIIGIPFRAIIGIVFIGVIVGVVDVIVVIIVIPHVTTIIPIITKNPIISSPTLAGCG